MPDDDLDPSLSDRIRSLPPNSPELWREVLLELSERVEEATAVEEVLRRAGGAPYRTRPSPKHKRDRHGLHMIPGGLAAFAPLAPMAFLFHDGIGAGVCTVLRLSGRSVPKHVQHVAAAVAISTGAALLVPTFTAVDSPAASTHPRPAVTCSHRCRAEAERDQDQFAASSLAAFRHRPGRAPRLRS